MNKYTIVLGIILIIAAVGYSRYKKHSEEQEDTDFPVNNPPALDVKDVKLHESATTKTIRELHKEIAALKTRISQVETLAKSSIQDKTEVLPAAKVDPLSDQELAQKERAYFESVDFRFRGQPVDAKWSDEVMERIESAAYSGTSKGLAIDHIECRSSMCRLELPGNDPAVVQALRSDFRARVADLFSAGVASADESGKLVVYLATTSKEFPANK